MRHISAVLAVLALTSAPILAAGPEGTYCGKLKNGALFVDVVTVFGAPGTSGIIGSYLFIEQGNVEPGALVSRDTGGKSTVNFIWTDRFGTGRLTVTFSPDYSSFTGMWGSNGQVPSSDWNGSRCKEGSRPGLAS